MSKIYLIIFLMLLAIVVGGAAFLATWDIPPPTNRLEKVLPNDRFPR